MYVKRDAFARETIHKTRDRDGQCAWCGQVDPQSSPESRARRSNPPLHRIYRFRSETDGGRVSEDSKTFCTLTCRKAYWS